MTNTARNEAFMTKYYSVRDFAAITLFGYLRYPYIIFFSGMKLRPALFLQFFHLVGERLLLLFASLADRKKRFNRLEMQ